MHFNTFILNQKKANTITQLNKKRYWVTCVYITNNTTLAKNTKPTQIEFEIESRYDLWGFPVFNLYRLKKDGDRAKTMISPKDNAGNFLYIFDTEAEAITQYQAMLDDAKLIVRSRIEELEKYIESVK